MAFRIERGAFKIFDSTLGRYKERFKFNNDGNFVELNADGTEKGATFTTDGGTVTGAAHFTHTSNTYAGTSATLSNYYINNSQTRLHEGNGNSLRVTTPNGYIEIGSQNSGWVHIQTNRNIYFLPSNRDGKVAFDGHIEPYTNGYNNLGTATRRWNGIYGTNGDFSGNLTVGGTITAQEFRTEFVNQTIIQETGDVQVDGELTFTGAATTSNQSYGIVWSGFDKEGTTDTSDSAYIKHTTNTGGFSGSVLVIHSANDANDGIAFSTHASSPLKHNGNVIWSEGNALYRVTSQDVNAATRTTWYSNYTSGDAANRVRNHSTVYTLGGVNTLQLSTNTDYDETALWFRQYNNNGASPNGAGWQSWKKVATEDWVTSQISSTSGISQATADARYLRLSGNTSTVNLNNQNITNVNSITIGDPGPGEGFLFGGGNGWRIVESPNDITTNSAGNLQFTKGTTRLMTINTDNNVEIVNKLLIGGANDNSGKADFAVGVGGDPALSFRNNQVQIGGSDINYAFRLDSSIDFSRIKSWERDIIISVDGHASSTGYKDIRFYTKPSGAATTERMRIDGAGYTYFHGLDLAISNINSDHGVANYFRGSNTHLVIGTGGTLYLNYGNDSGQTRIHGDVYLNNQLVLDQNRVLRNITGTNDVVIGTSAGGTSNKLSYNLAAHFTLPAAGTRVAIMNVAASTVARVTITGSENGYFQPINLFITRNNTTVTTIIRESVRIHGHSNDIMFSTDSSGNIYAEKSLSTGRPVVIRKIEQFTGNITVLNGSTTNTGIGSDQSVIGIGNTDIGTNTVWHSGNDGSGSGLDADTLDGQQPSQAGGGSRIAQYASNGYLYANNWIHPANGTGLFWDSGPHFYETGGRLFSSHPIEVSDDIRIENAATHDRYEKGSAFINPRDPWDNFHLHGEYGAMYFDSSTYFFRSTDQQNTWVTINSNGIGIGISPSSNYKLTLSGAGIRMNNTPIHYTSEIHFNSGSRFKSFSATYTEHRSDSGTSTGIALSTAGSVRGYLYAENNNHIGILDAGASWGIRHRNDEGTEFFTDNGTKEFTIGRDLVTGNYGTVQTHTTRGGYGGYSISGQYVFMSDGTNVGLYNDIDNEWMIYTKRNAEVELMYNGSTKLETTNTGVTISGHIQVNAPAAPAGASCAIVGDTIEVSFDPSSDTVDYYQVWASQDGGSYSLISQVPKQDFAPFMTIVDTTFSVSGLRAYRVYAIKNGVYSDPATTSRTYTQPALEPVNMSVVPMEEAFFVQWSAPDSRFVDHYEVWVDTHATQSSLSRSNATLVYSGNNTFYMHAASTNEYHQFWVEISES